MANRPTFKGRKPGSRSADDKPRNPDGSREQKGYAGSSDSRGDLGNFNTDPGQATREQQQNQEAGKPLNADTQNGSDK